VTGELSKLLDEIKLCQEKDYSFEDLCHTISDHYLDNLSKISEEELGKNGSQSVVSKGGNEDNTSVFASSVYDPSGMEFGALLDYQIPPQSSVNFPVSLSLMFIGFCALCMCRGRNALINHLQLMMGSLLLDPLICSFSFIGHKMIGSKEENLPFVCLSHFLYKFNQTPLEEKRAKPCVQFLNHSLSH
jgi:hypothetical protein